MSKEQVIDYVMTTPGNPNRAVLSGMLDSLAGGGMQPLIVNERKNSDDEWELDKTFQEILDAFSSGYPVIVHSAQETWRGSWFSVETVYFGDYGQNQVILSRVFPNQNADVYAVTDNDAYPVKN